MRLTLRTLLAYLDDILDANQTREIGARISENATASSLVARIRDVTRRRRIGSPDLSGPGSKPDPNIVAEYLDNTLDPASVADLERVCLESDMHLAEVAACHQILTIVLGEPVTIRPELRERMYALGSPPTDSPSVPFTPAPASYAVGSTPVGKERPVVPDYLRRPPIWKRTLPMAIVLGFAAVWAYVLWTSGILSNGDARTVASSETNNQPSEKAKSVVEKLAAKPEAVAAPMADAAVAANAAPTIDVPMPAVVPMPMLEPPMPAVAAIPPLPIAETVPQPNVAAPAIPAPPPAGIPAEVAAALPAPNVMYTSNEGVLLHRPKGRGDWFVLPRRALIHPGDEVASPEPFASDLTITSGDDPNLSLKLQLEGGTRITLLPGAEMMIAEIAINRGRVDVSRPIDGLDRAIGLGVTVNGFRTEFDAVTPKTRFGLWVTLPKPNGPLPMDPLPKPIGTLFVTSGTVNVRRDGLPPIAGDGSVGALDWTDGSKDAFGPLVSIPPWLDPDYRPLPSQRNYSKSYESEFILDQPVQHSIVPVVERDLRETISRYGAQTMGLIDDVPSLVQALTSRHELTRHDAMTSLREWSVMAPENAQRLADEIGLAFREHEAPVVFKLLCGVPQAEAHDEAASARLVDWLASDNIAIRDLAILSIYDLTKRTLDYHPQNRDDQREAAVSRWREVLKKNKALLPPAPAAN